MNLTPDELRTGIKILGKAQDALSNITGYLAVDRYMSAEDIKQYFQGLLDDMEKDRNIDTTDHKIPLDI